MDEQEETFFILKYGSYEDAEALWLANKVDFTAIEEEIFLAYETKICGLTMELCNKTDGGRYIGITLDV